MNRLVIFAPNWLGDAVMALPAIADIRRARPGASLTVAARRSVAPLFALVPGVDHVMTFEQEGWPYRSAIAALREGTFDAVLLLPNSFHAAFLAWRAGVPERWGYRANARGGLLTRAIPRPPRAHQVTYYQHLVQAIGFPNGPAVPALEPRPEHRRAGRDLLTAAGWDEKQPLVALAPGAAYGGAKRWPARSFAALAAALARDGVGTVIVGSAGDRGAGIEIEQAMGSGTLNVVNVIGRTDLPALAGVLAACRGLVTNDSGAMHFAAALGVAVTAMFGPTNERETRPMGAVEPVVLTHEVWCRPCMLRECPIDHRCMRGITVDAVLAAARRTL